METAQESIPLLKPGLHDFSLDEIGNHFLKDFPESKTRKPLIDGLNVFISYLSRVGVPVELWIDGSFTTQKNDPNDIDVVIFAPAALINALPLESQKLLNDLIDRASVRHKFGCDVLFAPTEDTTLRSYWRGWYGFDRSEQPKGIARVMVTP